MSSGTLDHFDPKATRSLARGNQISYHLSDVVLAEDDEPLPERIGRYSVRDYLGRGGFGAVYLAFDDDLLRQVAIKVPRSSRFSSDEDREQFMAEARTAAQLEHPAIVPVHDVFQDADRVVIVQRFVQGEDLGKSLQSGLPPPERAAELMAAIAEAVGFAHQKGFVHRDLKPSNILLDERGQPHVTDFGLAIHESIQGRLRGERSGTPAYNMSPELVRGETHRLDGRSDLWSLGVILYEMLIGRPPFSGDDLDELFDEIQHRDPKPPSQVNPELPAELERICLKCLSKRITDRYSGAAALARDLRHWLTSGRKEIERGREVQKAKIVPKGLRSFEAEDADFFLDLLPGPRDRDGLPESIRFWKTRIEQTDADQTFSVGLIYGPSGCGKSSLVRAGLLPRLGDHVFSVYVEATAGETETRLARGLGRCSLDLSLAFLDAAVGGLAEDGKVVCARLAVFAEMMKGKPWTQASLRDVGGTEGIGVTFLEETFAARTAPPNYRLHQAGIRAVLNALLPAKGTDIKGRMRPHEQLLQAAKYEGRPPDFDALLGILDKEVRLITPTEPDGGGEDRDLPTEQSAKYYQLSHDYLVPSLRRWLRRKETESYAGRARLRLADRAAFWKAKPETQQLPAAWEYVNIRALTRKPDWTDGQRRMMSAATRYYALRTAALAVLIVVLAWGSREMIARMNSSALVNSLLKAEASKVLEIVDNLQPYMTWVRERLQQSARLEPKTPDEARQQLHARLALVGTDENQVAPLFESLLTASPEYVGLIRNGLRSYKEKLTKDLWEAFHSKTGSADRRFRAGMALADYVPGWEKWKKDDYRFLAEQLLLENPKDQPVWLGYVRSVSSQCIPHWERRFSDTESSELELVGAANALAEFAGDDQKRIARLLTVANPKQYAILFPLIASSPDEVAKKYLAKKAAELPPDDLSSVDRVPFGRRRAGAGITLLRLGERESVKPQASPATPCSSHSASIRSLRSQRQSTNRSSGNLAIGTSTIPVLPSTARADGCCGSGATMKSFARWTRHRFPILPIASGSRWRLQ